MTTRTSLTGFALVLALWSVPSWSDEPGSSAGSDTKAGAGAAHWDYDGDEGPSNWAQLSPEYSACAQGRSQSPIDLPSVGLGDPGAVASDFNPADFEAHPNEHLEQAFNNGHTIQVDFHNGDSLIIGEERFQLAQFHFYAPSEHTISGRSLPMEVHLVHRSESGALAVLGILVVEGEHNPAYDPIWKHLPREAGARHGLEELTIDLEDLLPKRRLAFRYLGSLTTPPCAEGVRWFVLAQPVALSAEQIATFTAIYDHNNRPTQPLYGRSLVLERLD